MPRLEFKLSVIELAIAHGTVASVHQLSAICSEFIIEGRKFSAEHGLDARPLDMLAVVTDDLQQALKAKHSLRIASIRSRALRIVTYLRDEGSLVRTERYELEHLPDALRAAH